MVDGKFDIVCSSDCRYQSLSIFSLLLKVMKTLSYSFYLAIWANGNEKNVLVVLSHSLFYFLSCLTSEQYNEKHSYVKEKDEQH